MKSLFVFINDQRIGLLKQFDGWREEFDFDVNYVDCQPSRRPVLGLFFEDRFPNSIRVDGPISWFTHLLPQGAMLRWQCRQLGIERSDSFELLKNLGGDLPGAVRLVEMNDRGVRSQASHFVQLSGDETATMEGSIDSPKFSLAGVQWKLPAKLSSTPDGKGLTAFGSQQGKSVICKFDSPGYDFVPQNEFASMRWAKEYGLEVPLCALHNRHDFMKLPANLPVGDGKVFVIERFDRTGDNRIQVEDFAQVFDRPVSTIYQGDYEEIAQVLAVLAPQSILNFLRHVIFIVCCGNGDAHLKNFSLLYEDIRRPRLSPVYDQVATIAHGDKDLALRLGGSKDWEMSRHRFDSLVEIAREAVDVPREFVAENVEAAISSFKSIEALYPDRHRKQFTRHFHRLASLTAIGH